MSSESTVKIPIFDSTKICQILMANPTLGPDTDEVLCSAVNKLNYDSRKLFAKSFTEAIKKLLAENQIDIQKRDISLDSATHVLAHLQSLKIIDEQENDLIQLCLEWLALHHQNVMGDWYTRGSVLRILRLLNHQDKSFWQTEFDHWIKQLIEQPDRFVHINRNLMQAIRALGQSGELNSRNLGALLGHGLRGKYFPVHELYAALEEICKHENLDGPNVAVNLYSNVVRNAMDASSPDAMPYTVQEANVVQMKKTLQSWIKNCLHLKIDINQDMPSTYLNERRPIIGFDNFYKFAA